MLTLRRRFALLAAIAALLSPLPCRGQTGTPTAVERPLLWRIEGPVPSFVFGTIHLPDERVTSLPDVVQQALTAADAVYTEIPMEMGELMKAAQGALLPKGESLQARIGEELYRRAQAFLEAKGASPTALDRLVPWAAASQLTLLDQMASKQPLDMVLWSRAKKAKKHVRGLETVAEQMAVFESLTAAEQVQFFAAALERAEKDLKEGKSSAEWILGLYLRGDEQRLERELNDYPMGDEALKAKLMTALLDTRNFRMADRIVRQLQEEPEQVHFFAVGAAHCPGTNGLLPLLHKRGYRLTRFELGGADAAAAAASIDAAIAAHEAAIEQLRARRRELAPAGAGK
jgi:uncharacterized protein